MPIVRAIGPSVDSDPMDIVVLASVAFFLPAAVLSASTPIVATLVTYIAIQGVSLVLRPFQGGYISFTLIDGISHSEGGIAIAFVLAIVAAVGMERALRTARWGRSVRAIGSRCARPKASPTRS